MRLTIESFARNNRSIRRVLDYVGDHIDNDIRLDYLADLACLSPNHFERLYFRKVRESPMATLRRLRLTRAYQQLQQGEQLLTRVGFDAGYGSNAAFTHAFVKAFGIAPSRVPALRKPLPTEPNLRVEHMGAHAIVQIHYDGRNADAWQAGSELLGRVAVSGAKRWRLWRRLDRDNPFALGADDSTSVTFMVATSYLPNEVVGVERAVLLGGLYAVFSCMGREATPDRTQLFERIEKQTDCYPIDGEFILREIKVSGYTAPQERHVEICIPVAMKFRKTIPPQVASLSRA